MPLNLFTAIDSPTTPTLASFVPLPSPSDEVKPGAFTSADVTSSGSTATEGFDLAASTSQSTGPVPSTSNHTVVTVEKAIVEKVMVEGVMVAPATNEPVASETPASLSNHSPVQPTSVTSVSNADGSNSHRGKVTHTETAHTETAHTETAHTETAHTETAHTETAANASVSTNHFVNDLAIDIDSVSAPPTVDFAADDRFVQFARLLAHGRLRAKSAARKTGQTLR